MRVLSHPFRVDSNGRVVTVEQYSGRQAAELAGAVVATVAGERGLAPSYGLTDPSGGGVDGEQVAGLIELCEPDLAVVSVDVTGDGSGYVTVKTNVEWVEE